MCVITVCIPRFRLPYKCIAASVRDRRTFPDLRSKVVQFSQNDNLDH